MHGNVYSPLKLFQFPDKVASLPADRPLLPPVHVRLKPVNACNHRCWYCAYLQPDLQLGAEMDTKDIIPWPKMEEIIEDLVGMGVKAVTFSGGGEPWLYPRLAECVERLAAGGIAIASLTNGSRLASDAGRAFAARGTWVRVSMDGWDDASYAAYRNIKEGAFSRLMADMAAFRSYGGPCRLGVCMNVDERNAAHIHELAAKVKAAGAASFKIAEVVVSNDGLANADYHRRFLPLVEEQVKRVQDDFAGPGFEVYPAFHGQAVSFDKPYDWCPMQQMLTVIGADLCVYSCHDKAYTAAGRLGSIKDRRFRDFWLEDKARLLRIRPCRDCRHHCTEHGKNQLLLSFLQTFNPHAAFV